MYYIEVLHMCYSKRYAAACTNTAARTTALAITTVTEREAVSEVTVSF
jgi:hypothetical protein